MFITSISCCRSLKTKTWVMTSRASRHRWTTAYFAASVATCSKTRYRRRVSMRTASRASARGWCTRTRVPMIDSRCTSTNSVHFSATCRTNWTIFRFVVSTSRMAVRLCTVWALPNSTKDNVSTWSCNVRTPVVPWSSTAELVCNEVNVLRYFTWVDYFTLYL